MTINSTTRKAGPFTGTGTVSAFPFGFKVFQASDLFVVRLDVSASVEQTLVLNANYNVTLNPDQNSNPGGIVTLTAPLAVGYTLTLTSDVPDTQPTDLTNQGGFYPDVINDALDRATIQIQQVQTEIDRTITAPISLPAGTDLTFPMPEANQFIGWNSTATALQNLDSSTLASIVAFATAYADTFDGDGVTSTFALSSPPATVRNLDVSINGVTQVPVVDYDIAGQALNFTTPPPLGSVLLVKYWQALPNSSGAAQDFILTPNGYTTAIDVQEGFDDLGSSAGTSKVGFLQAGTGAQARTAQAKLRDTISVKDFGAVGDGVTDDTAAIQAAFDYAVQNGIGVYFPGAKYRTTSELVIDRSFSPLDPTQGGRYGVALTGDGALASMISSDHAGICIRYIGGPSSGIHFQFGIDGLCITQPANTNVPGSIGLKIERGAFIQIRNFDISWFEYGLYCEGVLSSNFSDGTIRLNKYGFRFERGSSNSHPNNITWKGITVLNNRAYGGYLIKPSEFNFIGGSIESNGYSGILADPNTWGLYVEEPGAEGCVGINMNGVYIENNNGKADVWIVATTTANNRVSMNTFTGCSFLRFLNTRYATNNILLQGSNPSFVSISGCAFKDYSPYVSDASRLWVASSDAQVFDGGGNLFYDTTGGYVGLARAVFAPIGSNHQVPYAALPSETRFRNGIQYCADGSGAGLPSLAVSDGSKWWQIVLGQFGGSVQSTGTANTLPRDWTVSKIATGAYRITHNLNINGLDYSVVASPVGSANTGYCSGMSTSNNTFEVYFSNTSGASTDMAFNFTLSVI